MCASGYARTSKRQKRKDTEGLAQSHEVCEPAPMRSGSHESVGWGRGQISQGWLRTIDSLRHGMPKPHVSPAYVAATAMRARA